MIRYGLVGVLNTLVCLAVMYSLIYWGGVGPYAANAAGYVVGFMASFVFNKIWTFGNTSSLGRALPRYLACAAIAYGMNLGVVYIGVCCFGVDPYSIQLAGAVTYTAALFVLSKIFVFVEKPGDACMVDSSDIALQPSTQGRHAAGNAEVPGGEDFGARKDHLLVAYYPPQRGTGGGLRLLDLYALLVECFPAVRFSLLTCRHPGADPVFELSQLFEEVCMVEEAEFTVEGLTARGVFAKVYDVVDLQFLQSGDLTRAFRASGVPLIVVSPMESLVRSAWLGLRNTTVSAIPTLRRLRGDLQLALRELSAVLRADKVMCVSENDARFLRLFRFWGGVHAVETGVSASEFPSSLGPQAPLRCLDHGRRVTFLAYFGSQTNRDALAWFLDEVHPVLLETFADYRFRVVGRGLECLPDSAHEGVDWVGEVDSLERELQSTWVGIAPALGGAGLRGKINQYAIVGVPCVASFVAGAGLAYRDGVSIRLAADADAFAQACVALLGSAEANLVAGMSARQVCVENYAWNSRIDQLRDLFSY